MSAIKLKHDLSVLDRYTWTELFLCPQGRTRVSNKHSKYMHY